MINLASIFTQFELMGKIYSPLSVRRIHLLAQQLFLTLIVHIKNKSYISDTSSSAIKCMRETENETKCSLYSKTKYYV